VVIAVAVTAVTEFIDYFNQLICFCSQHSYICIYIFIFISPYR